MLHFYLLLYTMLLPFLFFIYHFNMILVSLLVNHLVHFNLQRSFEKKVVIKDSSADIKKPKKINLLLFNFIAFAP